MSSRSGLVGIPGAAAYAASKAAIRNHSKSVALYAAQNGWQIRCNSIHPAAILTPIWEPMIFNLCKRNLQMRSFQSMSALVGVVFAVSACGGGADDEGSMAITSPRDDVAPASYFEINETSATTSTLGGTHVRNDGAVRNISGVFTHNTGATAFSDGTTVLDDPSGGTRLTMWPTRSSSRSPAFRVHSRPASSTCWHRT